MNLRQQRAQQTKKKITETALKLFEKKGFSHVSVDEINRKAGTSKGAFYTHFKSKHDIFAEKFREIDHYYTEHLIPQIDDISTTYGKLQWFLEKQAQYLENDLGWDVIRTIYEQELNANQESFLMNQERPLYELLTNLFEKGRAEGEFRADLTAAEMVDILMRTVRGLLYDWSVSKGEFSLVEEQMMLFSVVLDGLKTK